MAPANRTAERFSTRRALIRTVASGLAAFMMMTTSLCYADPSSGWVENWSGTSTDGWSSAATLTNPGTGGVGGAGDGFLNVSLSFSGHLGAMSTGSEYSGDWSGIQLVSFWLKDTGILQPALEIHFGIGNQGNFWLSTQGFKPTGSWKLFTVTLAEANFTQIITGGTFDDAIHTTDRILLRHDVAPFLQTPNSIQGDFGIDGLSLSNGATPAANATWGRIKALYR